MSLNSTEAAALVRKRLEEHGVDPYFIKGMVTAKKAEEAEEINKAGLEWQLECLFEYSSSNHFDAQYLLDWIEENIG